MDGAEVDGGRRKHASRRLTDAPFTNGDAFASHGVGYADRLQCVERVLLERETVPDRLQFGRLFEEPKVETEVTKCGGQRHAADSAADDVHAQAIIHQWTIQ